MKFNRKINRIKRARKGQSQVTGRQNCIKVFRSLKHTYAQLVHDNGRVISATSDLTLSNNQSKIDRAFQVGQRIAKIAQKNQVSRVVFDRSGYKYHGRVKAIAEGARQAGLDF